MKVVEDRSIGGEGGREGSGFKAMLIEGGVKMGESPSPVRAGPKIQAHERICGHKNFQHRLPRSQLRGPLSFARPCS